MPGVYVYQRVLDGPDYELMYMFLIPAVSEIQTLNGNRRCLSEWKVGHGFRVIAVPDSVNKFISSPASFFAISAVFLAQPAGASELILF